MDAVMRESSGLVQAESEFVSAVTASGAAPGQMMQAILGRYQGHDEERRSVLTTALAGALATRIAVAKARGEGA